jgi:DNA-binding NtrC family response regulator
MDNSHLPDELKDAPWLALLSRSQYISMLLDPSGHVEWIAYGGGHYHQEMVNLLKDSMIQDFYNIPQPVDLNKIMQDWIKEQNVELPDADNLSQLDSSLFSYLSFPAFQSKNLAEQRDFMAGFIWKIPLSRLYLFRLNAERFIGLVDFPKYIHKLDAEQKKNVAYVDSSNRIIGITRFFAHSLTDRDPEKLLDTPLSDRLTFNSDPARPPADLLNPALSEYMNWKGGKQPFAFTLVSGDNPPASQGSRLSWDTTKSKADSILLMEKSLPVDDHHVRVEIEFSSDRGNMPSLIIRGTEFKPGLWPDLLGYCFTANSNQYYLIKKSGEFKRSVAYQQAMRPGTNRLVISKTFDFFEVYLNREKLMEWRDPQGFYHSTENLLYLFLNPGYELKLHGLQILNAPVQEPLPSYFSEPLTAKPVNRSGNASFQVHFEQETFLLTSTLEPSSDNNYTRFEFEDIQYFTDRYEALRREHRKLAKALQTERVFVGQSPEIQRIKEELETVADSDLAVLIEGETGTGKEVLAQIIHESSGRKDKPFIKVDCSTLPSELFESELFGHEKGSFTGAVSRHIGRFEKANGGTIFLDEISNLSMGLHAELLYILQDFKINRIGGDREISLNVRVITASNIPLKSIIASGRFRQDLYYRINQYAFFLPPLRSRKNDIPLLAEHFVREANAVYKKSVKELSPRAMEKLFKHHWPGNVRELRTVIMRAIIFSKKKVAEPEFMPEELEAPVPEQQPVILGKTGPQRRKKIKVTKGQFIEALEEYGGIVSRAADKLGINRMMAYRLIKKFNINLEDYRQYE